MDTNKRFLRYNSITIVVWPIISVWLPGLLTGDLHFFSIVEIIWVIMPLAFFSILIALPFILFAYWARLKIKLDNSNLMLLKSLAYTFYLILILSIIPQLVILIDSYLRTVDGVNIGLAILAGFLPVVLAILMPAINSIIYKILARNVKSSHS